ncbi:unnamed protein product [Cunninghamella echinulata]
MLDSETASDISGYLSIICWFIVFIPQLWENYVRKSGDGVSMTFLVIWLAGDIFNLAGVILQDLLPTMFLLALWYTIADIGLIWQVIYYQRLPDLVYDEEEVSLLDNEHGHSSSNNSSNNSDNTNKNKNKKNYTSIQKHPYDKNFKYNKMTIWFNIISAFTIFLIFLASCLAYGWKHYYQHDHQHHRHNEEEGALNEILWLPQVFGWASAILYIGSRIPQIVQNFRKKSTEGLSLGMFLCALFGNIFFTLSIFLRSTDPQYLLINLSWIVGSCGTLVFDFTIFTQFYIYKSKKGHQHRKSHDYVE